MNKKISLRVCVTLVSLFVAVFGLSVSAQELTADQVVEKHRAAIGAKEKLSSLKNQMVFGDARFTFKGSAAVASGKALILSEGEKSLWGMNFNSNDYPQDRFAFDGKDVRIGRPSPTVSRSLLGEFIYNNRALLKEGLLGGALSSSWVLLTDRKGKLQVEGKKSIDGKDTIVMSYQPKGTSDVSIKIYLDEKTYQHIRTEYTVVRAATQGTSIDNSANTSSFIYKMVEEFSDFAKAGDLILPKKYRITYSRTGTASVASSLTSNRDAEWTFTVTNVTFNQALEAGSFNIDG